MHFRFKFERALQASARLLRLEWARRGSRAKKLPSRANLHQRLSAPKFRSKPCYINGTGMSPWRSLPLVDCARVVLFI